MTNSIARTAPISGIWRYITAVVGLGVSIFLLSATASAAERHSGYYYPDITSSEIYAARSRVVAEADRRKRIGFVVAHTLQQGQQSYPPRYALFAKGEAAEKLIIVGLDGSSFSTLFRARAVLAQLTAVARSSELFREFGVADSFTFFDLVRMLGFVQITVSDGDSYAHRVILE